MGKEKHRTAPLLRENARCFSFCFCFLRISWDPSLLFRVPVLCVKEFRKPRGGIPFFCRKTRCFFTRGGGKGQKTPSVGRKNCPSVKKQPIGQKARPSVKKLSFARKICSSVEKQPAVGKSCSSVGKTARRLKNCPRSGKDRGLRQDGRRSGLEGRAALPRFVREGFFEHVFVLFENLFPVGGNRHDQRHADHQTDDAEDKSRDGHRVKVAERLA